MSNAYSPTKLEAQLLAAAGPAKSATVAAWQDVTTTGKFTGSYEAWLRLTGQQRAGLYAHHGAQATSFRGRAAAVAAALAAADSASKPSRAPRVQGKRTPRVTATPSTDTASDTVAVS